jgi:serine phosphatase RsbU (regulator of sigma subunit)
VTTPSTVDLAPLNPDYLVPMLSRDGRLSGLLVLGPRRSEEPYSGEDKRLLASVASQAATAMENIRLAQEIADRMERERRVAREMEIAKEVQLRLLPQTGPRMKTMEAAARCIQARSVGGDYYDFLDLGADRAGLVLADVSGKGVHAALLVANLQAYLRSQSAITPRDPVRVLDQVNRILWKSTAAQHYATLFFGVYDDAARQLSYVNCGHNPPLCLRQDGSVERLAATATVIGLFEQWECSLGILQLAPGDLLAIFSDGVTEEARDDEEFGEQRLIDELQSTRERPLDEIITGVFESVQRFSPDKQSDDLTLLVARIN